MEYFFDKSLKEFKNQDGSLKVYLSSTHISVVDSKKGLIRMPIRAKRLPKGEKPPYWKYIFNRLEQIITLDITFEGIITTTITIKDDSIKVKYISDEFKGKNQKVFYWEHKKGENLQTETKYI